jgi:hypothetical protein
MATKKLSDLPVASTIVGTETIFGLQSGVSVQIPYGSFNGITSTGSVGIGTSSPNNRLDVLNGVANSAGDSIASAVASFTGLNYNFNTGSNPATFQIQSNSTLGIDVGATIGLGGRYTGTSFAQFAIIKGAKENATDGNFASYLAFGTRLSGNQVTEKMRITSAGGISFGSSGTAYGTSGQVLTSAGNAAPTWTTPTTGTVTSVGGTGTVSGLTLTGTVTSTGSLTLGGTLALGSLNTSGTAAGLSATLIVGSGGTGVTTLTGIPYGNATSAFTVATAAQLVTAIGASTTSVAGSMSAADKTKLDGITGTLDLKAPLASPTLSNPTYTGTLTGSTDILNIGSGQVYKDASGNVGIGCTPTSIPATGNPVVGASNLIMYNAGDLGLTLLTDNAATRTQQIGFGSAGISLFDAGLKYDNSSRSLQLWTGASVKTTIDVFGNVGIGASIPGAKLHVFGNNGIFGLNSFFGLNSSTAGIGIGNNASIGLIQGMATATSSTTADIAINPNGGNVGIGTASPTSKLDVYGGYITTANSQLSFGDILSTTASLVAGNWYRIATFPASNQGQDVEIHIRHGHTHNNTVIKVAKGTGQWRAEVYRAGYYVNPTDNAGYPAINKVRVYDIGVNSATHIDVQILGNTGSLTYNVIVKNDIADVTGNRITLVGFTDQGTTPAGIEFQAIGTMASWGNNGGQRVTFNENGNISGTNITTGGDVTGSSTSCTGNAATATNQSGGTVSATTGAFSGTTSFPCATGAFNIQNGTGDGASFTVYNTAIHSHWGIGFRDYQDLTTVKAYIDCRSGDIGTSGSFVGANVPVISGTAPVYACRAWVNFNGTGAPMGIRASGNVSSITDNGTGSYTVNFITAMPDINYAAVVSGTTTTGTDTASTGTIAAVDFTSSNFRIDCETGNGTPVQSDFAIVCAAIFR